MSRFRIISPFGLPEDQEKLHLRPWGEEQLKQVIKEAITNNGTSIKKILDVGFGATARSTRALMAIFRNAEIVAIENNVIAIEKIHERLSNGEGTNTFSKVKFYFGDPEFAIPKDIQADLILLSMVMHCFDYPYRALAHLIQSTFKPGGRILFIHRNDPFMKAVCGMTLTEEENKNKAAAIMQEAWRNNRPAPAAKLICEHSTGIKHFMEEAGFKIENEGTSKFEVDSESVQDVINEKRYSPLRDANIGIDTTHTNEHNSDVHLHYVVYQDQFNSSSGERRILDFSKHVFPSSIHTGILRKKSIDSLSTPTTDDHPHKKDIGEWFIGQKSPFDQRTLKYGFYVDLRRTEIKKEIDYDRVRDQLWPAEKLPHHPPSETSQSLIATLSEYTPKMLEGLSFWALIWVHLPDLKYWAEEYEKFDGVLDVLSGGNDSDVGQVAWHMIPHVTKDESGNFAKLLKKEIAGKKDEDTDSADDTWGKLSLYLTTLADVLRRKDVLHTYYFTFHDVYSRNQELVAFSFQATRWLSVNETTQLGFISYGALWAINEGLSSAYQLQRAEYEKIKQNLYDILERIGPLTQITDKIKEIQEIINPDQSFKGANSLDRLAKILDERLFPQGADHQPAGHNNANKLQIIMDCHQLLNEVKTDIRKHRDYGQFTSDFFSVWKNTDINFAKINKPLSSICLAKAISRFQVPVAWLAIVCGMSKDKYSEYWHLFVPDMHRSADCLRLVAGVYLLKAQCNLADCQLTISSDHILITGNPRYENFNDVVRAISPIIYGQETETASGSLRQALRWLMQSCGVVIGQADSIPTGKKGIVSIQEDGISLRIKMGAFTENTAGREDIL